MKGKINNQPLTTMINSGYPITKFTQADLREPLKVDICENIAQNRALCQLQQQTSHSTGIYECERKGRKTGNQKRQDCNSE